MLLPPNGHAPVLPSITVVQDGSQIHVNSTLAHPQQAIALLLEGLLAVHRQQVLQQSEQAPLIQPASPGDMPLYRPKETP